MDTFLAFLAAIGFGTLIAAGISHVTSISGFRQAWINALREDLAEFFKALEKADYVIQDWLTDLEKYKAERRDATMVLRFVFQRIRLRLNRTEDLHIRLEHKLQEFLDEPLPAKLDDGHSVNDAVDLARQVLKYEWEVTKSPWKAWFKIGQGFPDADGHFPLGE